MRSTRRVLYGLLLVAAGGMAACERTDGVGDLTGPMPTVQLSKVGQGSRLTRVLHGANTRNSAFTCSSPIGRNGGDMTFDGGSLEVTRNAVSHPTIFCAQNQTTAGGEIIVSLRAYEPGNNASVCMAPGNTAEIGCVTTFKNVVKLTIDLSDADIIDWTHVAVMYRGPNGFEQVPTAQDKNGQTVTANLTHFSDYSPVEN